MSFSYSFTQDRCGLFFENNHNFFGNKKTCYSFIKILIKSYMNGMDKIVEIEFQLPFMR